MENNTELVIEEKKAIEIKDILWDFLNEAFENKDKPVDEWLGNKIHSYLGGDVKDSKKTAKEIVESVNETETQHKCLTEAISEGETKEEWFDFFWKKCFGESKTEELKTLDSALDEVNRVLEDIKNGKLVEIPKYSATEGDEAPQSNWNDIDITKYTNKDLAKGVGKNAGKAGLKAFLVDFGYNLGTKLLKGENIDKKELLVNAVETGADQGVKSALAGALKVASEKGLIKALPKGTPVAVFANIAFVGVETIKTLFMIGRGDISVREGVERIAVTAVSTVAGIAGMSKGSVVGTAVGAVFGPVGAAIGGFVGGLLGGWLGATAGEKAAQELMKQRDSVKNYITSSNQSTATLLPISKKSPIKNRTLNRSKI